VPSPVVPVVTVLPNQRNQQSGTRDGADWIEIHEPRTARNTRKKRLGPGSSVRFEAAMRGASSFESIMTRVRARKPLGYVMCHRGKNEYKCIEPQRAQRTRRPETNLQSDLSLGRFQQPRSQCPMNFDGRPDDPLRDLVKLIFLNHVPLPRPSPCSSIRVLCSQPIMRCVLPVRVRLRELAVYPCSHDRRRFGVTRLAKARL